MSKNSSKALNWIAGGIAAYFVGSAIAGAIKRKNATSGIGATRNKKFYVYAGYWENYISSKPMPEPYILRRTFRSIGAAINYAVDLGDHVVYCDNVKYDLPDFLYDTLNEAGEFFKY